MATPKGATKKVAVIEGDDAAPEAVRPTIEVVRSLGLPIEWTYPLVGEAAKQAYDHPFPPVSRQAIDDADTTFFGSTSGSSGGSLMYLRWGKQTYANVRPARYFPGAKSPLATPDGVDLVIVRENLEDLYVRAEGDLEALSNLDIRSATIRKPVSELGEGRYAIKAITRAGTERVVRFAFELARRRRKHLTCTSKYNMLPLTDGYFRDIATELAADYPDVEFDTFIVDDFACRIISEPQRFDVIVMPNLYGDILSDAAAGLVGGLGLAASGCFGDDYAYFESAHGTAPDIAGLNIINPTANLLSAAMMLEYLGFEAEASSLDSAVRHVFATGELTPDQGGSASTDAFCEAVLESIQRE